MKARICTLAVTVVAAIVIPVSGAMIPPDPSDATTQRDSWMIVYGNGTRAPQVIVKQTPTHAAKSTKGKTTKRAVGRFQSPTGVYQNPSAYNPAAYVPGGSSQQVSKAIQSQGQRALR
jgi:hypothetical protein